MSVCRGRGGELHAREVLHFLADDGDASFVRGVEFEDAGLDQLGAVELFGEREDGGCLSGPRGAVEKHVWEVGGLEGSLENGDGVVLGCDIAEGFGPAVALSARLLLLHVGV